MEVARLAAEEVPEVAADHAALRHLLRKRKDKARAYFDELAGRFGKDYVPGRSWKALGRGAASRCSITKSSPTSAPAKAPSPNCWPNARKR